MDRSSSQYGSKIHGSERDRWPYMIQKRGHILGLQDRLVSEGLITNRAHVRLIIWSGSGYNQELIPGGLIVNGIKDVGSLVAALQNQDDDDAFGDGDTDHADILYRVLDRYPRMADRWIIDMSTDEPPRSPISCAGYRDDIQDLYGTINGIAFDLAGKGEVEAGLRECVKSRDGFTVSGHNEATYVTALTWKLATEIGVGV